MHPQEHDEHCHEATLKNLLFGIVGNGLLAIVEFVVFLHTNSVTVISASLHDAGDAITSLISFSAEKLAHRWKLPKLSLLAALLNSCIVIVSCIIMLWNAVHHLCMRAPVEVSNMWMLALLSFAVNLYLAIALGHGHSANEQSQANHFLEDALGAIAMFGVWLVSSIINPTVADPIASIGIAICILCRALPLILGTAKKLYS